MSAFKKTAKPKTSNFRLSLSLTASLHTEDNCYSSPLTGVMNGCPGADTCRGQPLWVMCKETGAAMIGSFTAGCFTTWWSDAFTDAAVPDIKGSRCIQTYINTILQRPHLLLLYFFVWLLFLWLYVASFFNQHLLFSCTMFYAKTVWKSANNSEYIKAEKMDKIWWSQAGRLNLTTGLI